MTAVLVGSVHGAPGATTTAAGLAACYPGGVLVEADCGGGVLAVRFGLAREPGVVTLAADRATSDQALAAHAQPVPGGLPVVVGPESAHHAGWLWRTAGDGLAASIDRHEGVAVVDVGRLGPDNPVPALFPDAPVLLVVRPRADELAVAAAHLAATGNDRRPALVLVGERPYSAAEVAGELRCEVLGVVADDPRGAATLWDGGSPRRLARSAFARSVRTLAEALGWSLGDEATRSTPRKVVGVR